MVYRKKCSIEREKTPTVKKTSKTDITLKHDNLKRRIDRKP